MRTLRIWKSNFERARDRTHLSPEELAKVNAIIGEQSGEVAFDPAALPLAMARSLLDDAKLKPGERAALALCVHGMRANDLPTRELYDTRVADPVEFGSILTASATGQPNAEVQWNGRWYPVIVLAALGEEDKVVKFCSVTVRLAMGGHTCEFSRLVPPKVFLGPDGAPRERTVLQVLEHLGFRAVQTRPADYNVRLVAAERLAAEAGAQVWVKGSVMEPSSRYWYSGLNEVALGTPELPRRAVVEPTLSGRNERDDYHPYGRGMGRGGDSADENVSRMPLVRVFSLSTKRYVFADIDDLEAYEYDDTALSRLHLPPDMRDVLGRVFAAQQAELFGDLMRGKHGGVVILASGNPGVGKTMTAEVYAEVARRPLYVLEFGELGTSVEQIEANLDDVFARVVRWRAVLQFDECEVFLAKRGEDLERSAIVGIFLRMLDYYEGLLFLTTNRPGVLDHAVLSRVMLHLEYPDLDAQTRADVWQSMFAGAGMTLLEGSFEDLANADENGRQSRNLVRLARILYPDRGITARQVRELRRYGCQ